MKAYGPMIFSGLLTVILANVAVAQPDLPPPYVNRVSAGDLRAYRIDLRSSQPIKVWVTLTVQPDACNRIGISGGFRKIELLPGTQSLMQDFVANVALASTLLGCPRGATNVRPPQVLQSQTLEIYPHSSGTILSTIYVPDGFELQVMR